MPTNNCRVWNFISRNAQSANRDSLRCFIQISAFYHSRCFYQVSVRHGNVVFMLSSMTSLNSMYSPILGTPTTSGRNRLNFYERTSKQVTTTAQCQVINPAIIPSRLYLSLSLSLSLSISIGRTSDDGCAGRHKNQYR